MAYEESYTRYSAENVFTGLISENGDIYNANYRGARDKIGIDNERESELLKLIEEQEEIIKNYYEKLVDLGVITPKKSAEEIAMEQAIEQARINQQLLEAIGALNAEIKELKGAGKNVNDRYGVESCGKSDEQNSADNGKKPTTSKGSSGTRKKGTSGSDQ